MSDKVNTSEIAQPYEKHRKYARTGLNSKSNDNILWCKLLADSKRIIHVDEGIFHYEMFIQAEQLPDRKFQSKSKIKFCVKDFEYQGKIYKFLINPVDKISRCIGDYNQIIIDWHEVVFVQPVLTRESLNFEEQMNVHLVRLESLIRDQFIPKIREKFRG